MIFFIQLSDRLDPPQKTIHMPGKKYIHSQKLLNGKYLNMIQECHFGGAGYNLLEN